MSVFNNTKIRLDSVNKDLALALLRERGVKIPKLDTFAKRFVNYIVVDNPKNPKLYFGLPAFYKSEAREIFMSDLKANKVRRIELEMKSKTKTLMKKSRRQPAAIERPLDYGDPVENLTTGEFGILQAKGKEHYSCIVMSGNNHGKTRKWAKARTIRLKGEITVKG